MEANKVMVELEWEQIDAIIRHELRDHIEMIHRELAAAHYIHPDDEADKQKLLPALYVVYEYWAGETEANKLKEEMGYETETD
jgi:hypothetical protein